MKCEVKILILVMAGGLCVAAAAWTGDDNSEDGDELANHPASERDELDSVKDLGETDNLDMANELRNVNLKVAKKLEEMEQVENVNRVEEVHRHKDMTPQLPTPKAKRDPGAIHNTETGYGKRREEVVNHNLDVKTGKQPLNKLGDKLTKKICRGTSDQGNGRQVEESRNLKRNDGMGKAKRKRTQQTNTSKLGRYNRKPKKPLKTDHETAGATVQKLRPSNETTGNSSDPKQRGMKGKKRMRCRSDDDDDKTSGMCRKKCKRREQATESVSCKKKTKCCVRTKKVSCPSERCSDANGRCKIRCESNEFANEDPGGTCGGCKCCVVIPVPCQTKPRCAMDRGICRKTCLPHEIQRTGERLCKMEDICICCVPKPFCTTIRCTGQGEICRTKCLEHETVIGPSSCSPDRECECCFDSNAVCLTPSTCEGTCRDRCMPYETTIADLCNNTGKCVCCVTNGRKNIKNRNKNKNKRPRNDVAPPYIGQDDNDAAKTRQENDT